MTTELTTYERETLTSLYAVLDHLTCYDLAGQEEIKNAINQIESKMKPVKTFKNKNYTKRNYECTNIVCCIAKEAPTSSWIECGEEELKGLTKLYTQPEVTFYGYM